MEKHKTSYNWHEIQRIEASNCQLNISFTNSEIKRNSVPCFISLLEMGLGEGDLALKGERDRDREGDLVRE